MRDSIVRPQDLEEPPRQDWLLATAALIFSDRITASKVDVPVSPREQWRQVANLAGVSANALAAAIAEQFGMANVLPGRPDKGLSRLVPESLALRHQMVPVSIQDNQLVIAVSSPYCAGVRRDVAFASGRQVEVRLAPPEEVESARLTLYSDETSIAHRGVTIVLNLDEEASAAIEADGDRKLVHFCRTLIRQAIDRGASDIHVHPFAGGGVTRLRIDGQLQRVATITNLVLVSLVRLMKVQGGMDPSNSLIPQDGSASVIYKQKVYDLRLSTLPSSGAEALVMRILDQSRAFSLDKTNFAPWALSTFRRLASSASGLFLITGPTGSGKTSTLYALLAELNQPHRRIITVEEPIEYKLPGITQVAVNDRAGLTFAKALRSILRQDPDVILIGEIRDAETAEIAVQAALTGHLVFATMHTQDAIRAITRLAELGVPTPLLADTILAVVSQRLLRQLCADCCLPVVEPLSEMERVFHDLVGSLPGARPQGCDKCNYTGFRGRIPIVEVVEINEGMRAAMDVGKSNANELLQHMPKRWHSIEERAAAWIEAGMTTVEEAFDGLGARFWSRLAHISGREAAVIPQAQKSSVSSQALPVSVLVISGDDNRRDTIVQKLEQVGVGAIPCGDPEAALALIRANRLLQHIVVDAIDSGNLSSKVKEEVRKVVVWSGLSVVLLHKASETFDPVQLARANIHNTLVYPAEADDLRQALENAATNMPVS